MKIRSGFARVGLPWTFRAAGLAIGLFGVYLAGGSEVACVSADRRAAECTVQTRRWLGRSVVDTSIYEGVTTVETITVRGTGQDAEDAWFLGLYASDAEVGRAFARRDRVEAAKDRLRAWMDGGMLGTVRVEWSSWAFGYAAMAFGAVIVTVTMAGARPSAPPSSSRARPLR